MPPVVQKAHAGSTITLPRRRRLSSTKRPPHAHPTGSRSAATDQDTANADTSDPPALPPPPPSAPLADAAANNDGPLDRERQEAVAQLGHRLGHTFLRPEQLHDPLRARRLAFLGRRVTGLVLLEQLLECPGAGAGVDTPPAAAALSVRMAELTRVEVAARAAVAVGAADAVVHRDPHRPGEALHAAVAAMYLDGGLDLARRAARLAWAAEYPAPSPASWTPDGQRGGPRAPSARVPRPPLPVATAAMGRRLGHDFGQPQLLLDAATAGSRERELLEFLGDRVLGLVVGEWLYNNADRGAAGGGNDNHAREGGDAVDAVGKLERRFRRLTSNRTLASVARTTGVLGMSLSVSATLRKTRNEHRRERGDARGEAVKPEADMIEALIGAVYLDGGVDPARDAVLRLWQTTLASEVRQSDDAWS